VRRVDELPQRVGRAADRRRHRPARADRHDLGACAARLPQPEIDHGRAIDDVVVAHDDDELGAADRRERRPEGVQRGGGRLVEHGGVRAEAAPQQHAEAVCDLVRLGAGERSHDRSPRAAEQLLGSVERGIPRDGLEPERTPLQRLAYAVLGPEVRVGEAALVAEPAAVDLGVVA
jgi:hypothetical protein